MSKKKILFALANMNVGGVEKSFLSLLNTIGQDEYEVDLLLLERKGGYLEYVPKWINIIEYGEYGKIKNQLNNPPVSEIRALFSQKKIKRALTTA